jgi:hypothetical protein
VLFRAANMLRIRDVAFSIRFPYPGSGSEGFRHGEQCPDRDIVHPARENGGHLFLPIFFISPLAALKLTSIRPASRAAGTNGFTDYIRI